MEKKLVFEDIIAPKSALAFAVKKGQFLRIIDLEGKQVGDLILFNMIIRKGLAQHIRGGQMGARGSHRSLGVYCRDSPPGTYCILVCLRIWRV